MQYIDLESVKRITNGDLIVRGYPEEILKSKYEDGWLVVNNLRATEELEVEKTGMLAENVSLLHAKRKLQYGELIDNHWYILDANLQ
jgi:hypothetical protein